MSKRLQVLLDEKEFRDLQCIARLRRMTLAEWVRQALREARDREPDKDSKKKLDVIRAAAQHGFPAGDFAQILGEIESGYMGDKVQ
jgi:hypothetical protein